MKEQYRPDPYSEEGDIFFATHCADCLKPNELCACSDDLEADLRDATEHPENMFSCVACQKVAVAEVVKLEAERKELRQAMRNLSGKYNELSAENERLKCCGNCAVEDCKSWSGEDGPFPYTWSRCQFLPSRWAERSTP